MVEVIPDVNLSFKEYQASLQQNPSNIFYQRIQSRNVSNQQCSFTVSSPNKRSYVLSNAQIEWVFTLTRRRSAGGIPTAVADPYAQSRDLISLKPVLPVANAMSAITISINGSTSTIAQPRRFMESLSMLHVSRDEAKLNYESGYPEKMGGQALRTFPTVTWGYNELDSTMMDQYYDFANRQLRDGISKRTTTHLTFFQDGDAARVQTGGKIAVTEPLICPPFDCYSKVDKSSMPDWSPWKWMSKVIPNVDRLEIDIQFTKLVESLMYFYYGRGGEDADNVPPSMTIQASDVEANLILYWTEVPVSTSIPRSIDLQTWNVREFQDSIGAAPNDVAAEKTSTLIQLNSVPSLIITHVERNRDIDEYQQLAATSNVGADNAQTRIRAGGLNHSWDEYAEINTITYLLGDRPNVISATFSQRELYDLTMKNSKQFPYTYADWRGRKRPIYASGAFQAAAGTQQGLETVTAAWHTYPTKCIVAVTGADIANKTSTGVFSSNSLQIVVNFRPHSGFAGIAGFPSSHLLYNHLIFGKEFLRIESDKSQFQSQSLDEATARRLTDPPLGSMAMPMIAGGALRVGGSLGVGGALAPLRNRGVSAIGSRLP